MQTNHCWPVVWNSASFQPQLGTFSAPLPLLDLQALIYTIYIARSNMDVATLIGNCPFNSMAANAYDVICANLE